MVQVALCHTRQRAVGVRRCLRALGRNPAAGKDVLIKPNFNTADAAPGSTHNDTLLALVDEIRAMGAASIAIGERSYPVTSQVMKRKGILPLLEARGVRVIDFDLLPKSDWVECKPPDSHWPNGFCVARPILDAPCLISTCCLKTHQYGGVFSLSLKLHVGVVPTSRHGFAYMDQLHGSPHQRKMIAEINQPFTPDLIVLDGVDAFVDGGPMTGQRANGDVVLAATDRIAIDAVGVAILKMLGSNRNIMERKIFDQEQIARAVELGIGVASADRIQIVPADQDSVDYTEKIGEILSQG